MNIPLHVGDKVVLQAGEILGIFTEEAGSSVFLERCAEAGAIRNVRDRNRSFVLIKRGGRVLVYRSKISARRLINRLNNAEVINGKGKKGEEGAESK